MDSPIDSAAHYWGLDQVAYLLTDYEDRKSVKGLGALWDPEEHQWYTTIYNPKLYTLLKYYEIDWCSSDAADELIDIALDRDFSLNKALVSKYKEAVSEVLPGKLA